MAIDIIEVGKNIASAFVGALKPYKDDIQAYAEAEAKKFAASLATIEGLYVAKEISAAEAALHLDIQKAASRAVLCAIEGIGLLAAEAAINAALAVVRDTVNTAIGFPLIVA